MKYSIIFLCLIAGLCRANDLTHGPMPNPSQYNYSIWLAKHLDISNGIQSYEASVIANVFFISGVSGCGTPGEPSKNGDYWVFPSYFGFAADIGPEIRVHLTTGAVESNGKKMSFQQIQNIELLDLPEIDPYE